MGDERVIVGVTKTQVDVWFEGFYLAVLAGGGSRCVEIVGSVDGYTVGSAFA